MAKAVTEDEIKTGGVAADRLRSIIERIERLEEERKALGNDIKDIYAYFARHTVDKDAKGWASRTDPSAGYIAWLLWGGDPAERWIGRLHDRLEKAAG